MPKSNAHPQPTPTPPPAWRLELDGSTCNLCNRYEKNCTCRPATTTGGHQ